MDFKNIISSDLSVFFNTGEFAESHKINNISRIILIDNDKLEELSSSKFQGISAGEILYYIPVSSYETRIPRLGDTQIFDTKQMYITYVIENDGVYEIALSQNRGE